MMLRIMSLVFSLVALTFSVKTYIVVKKRDIEVEEDFKKYNKEKKESFLIEKLQDKKKEVLERVSVVNQHINSTALCYNSYGGKLNKKMKKFIEENTYREEALQDVLDCIDETIRYLKNPDYYVSEKQIMMLQRKLSEKNKEE